MKVYMIYFSEKLPQKNYIPCPPPKKSYTLVPETTLFVAER